MFGLGMPELVIIFAIVFFIFGAGKLPELGNGMGKAIRNFKRSISNTEIEMSPEDEEKQKFSSSGEQQQKGKG